MYTENFQSIFIFTVCIILLLMLFGAFISTVVYRYKRNQRVYLEDLEVLRSGHHNDLLKGQLEIQEYTFSNISREIHDNVGQKLSLAMLLINTQTFEDVDTAQEQVEDSIVLLSEALKDLSDISKSMSSEIISNNGLVEAITFEISQLQKSGMFKAGFNLKGQQIFLDSQMELTIFRIIQESFHNIIKHANASEIYIQLEYEEENLVLSIEDNGTGFQLEKRDTGTGLANIKARTSMLDGKFSIFSNETGTCLNFDIPFKLNHYE